jgi:hypothetical protein
MRGDDVWVAGLASNYIRREDQLEVFLLPVLRRNRLNSAELVRIGEELARRQGAEDRKTGGGDNHLFGPWVENAYHESVVAGNREIGRPVVDEPVLAGRVRAIAQEKFAGLAVLDGEAPFFDEALGPIVVCKADRTAGAYRRSAKLISDCEASR